MTAVEIEGLRHLLGGLLRAGNKDAFRKRVEQARLSGRLTLPLEAVTRLLRDDIAATVKKFAAPRGLSDVAGLVAGFERRGGMPPIQAVTSNEQRRRIAGAIISAILDGTAAVPKQPQPAVQHMPGRTDRLPRKADELVAWAREHGVLAVLDQSIAGALGHALDPLAREILRRRPRLVTVGDLLLDTGAGGKLSSLLPGATFDRLVLAAVASVEKSAATVAMRLAEEAARAARRGPPPADPHLQRLILLVAAERARARQTSVPYLPERAVPRRFSPALASITIDLAVERETTSVVVDFARFPDAIHVACRCGRNDCQGTVTALDSLLDLLHDPAAAFPAELLAVLRVPAWQRTLDRLGTILDRSPAGAERADDARVVWRLKHGSWPQLDPYLQKRKKSGGWSAGTRLREFGELPPEQVELIERVMERLEPVRFGWSRGEGGVAAALELLVGADNVYLEADRDRPLAVRRGDVALSLVRGDDGRLRLEATVDGAPLPADVLRNRRSESRFFFVDTTRNAVFTGRLDRDVPRVLGVLGSEAFPDEAVPAILARLQSVERRVPLLLPPELDGESVPAEERMVLRLAPGASGIGGALRIRPLPEADDQPCGDGPSRVAVFRDGRRIRVERDLAGECRRGEELLASLPLANAERPVPFSFVLAGDDEALDLLAHLRERPDVLVEWPAEALARRVVGTAAPSHLRVTIEDRHDWFGLEGEVDVDGVKAKLASLLAAVQSGRRYVEVEGGKWLAISAQLRERLAAAADVVFSGRAGLETSRAGAAAVAELAESAAVVEACASWTRWITNLRDAEVRHHDVPAAFGGELRPYQVAGFQWLARLADWGVGGCLADDMGLGKTPQALAALLLRADLGPALVVAPTSVCFNWVRETERFAPGLRPILFRETDRASALAALGPRDLLIASYGLVVRHVDDLKKVRFATLVVDEAQAVKNAQTHRARAVRDLDAEWRVALSGTPVENHLGELWSLFRVVAPGLLGSWEQFRERFAAPIERDGDAGRRQALARVVRPFILRRTKARVAPELPARTEIRREVPLSAAERRLYDETRLALVAKLAAPSEARPEQQRFQVLAALTKLRQLACHPRLFDPKSRLGSSKLETLLAIVDELREGGHRALVFSQFTSHLALVRQALGERDVSYQYLDGQTPEAERAKRVDAFQRGEGDLFLISLKAGGTGLNLTAADYVIHLDPWWNPAVEDQATDRAHRIGQSRPVTVYRLIAQGTIEEAILALHDDKRDLVAGVLDGTDAAGRLSTEELLDLIRLGVAGAADDDGPVEAEAREEAGEPPARSRKERAPLVAAKTLRRPVAAPAPRKAAPAAAGNRQLVSLIAACKVRLAERFGDATSGTVKQYAAALERFRAWAEADNRLPAGDDLASLEMACDAYWRGLADGSIPGATSAHLMARAATGWLKKVASEPGARSSA